MFFVSFFPCLFTSHHQVMNHWFRVLIYSVSLLNVYHVLSGTESAAEAKEVLFKRKDFMNLWVPSYSLFI